MAGYLSRDYVISSEREVSELLSEVPLSLLKENITAQVINPGETNVDNLTVVFEKFDSIANEIDNDQDDLREINELRLETALFVIHEIMERFSIGVDINEHNITECIDLANSMYRSLILDYKLNLEKFFYSYVLTNKERLISQLGLADNKNMDFLTAAHKRVSPEGIDNVRLLSSLARIFKNVYDLVDEIEVTDFLQYAEFNVTEEGEQIVQMYDDYTMIGNFVPVYMNILTSENSYLQQEITSSVTVDLSNILLNL